MAGSDRREGAAARPRAMLLYPPTQEVCGVGSAVGTLAGELKSRGWDVVVGLAAGHRFHDPRHFRRRYPGVRTVVMDGRTGSREGRVRGVAAAIRRVRPAVVVATMMHDVFEAVRRLRGRGEMFPLVLANRCSLPGHAAAIIENLDVLDAVVCVNRLPALALRAVQPSLPPEAVSVIANGVPGPLAEPTPRRVVARIGYAGRLSADKRFGDFFPLAERLMRTHAHLEFWVAGAGPLEGELRTFAAAHPRNVRFFGARLREDLYREFYPQLDLYVHFSPTEGWCTSIGEAMAHGLVPVTSAFAGIRAEGLLLDGVNARIFPVGDTAVAAQQIAGLCADGSVRDRMGAAARRSIAAGFTIAHFAEAWSAFLGQVVRAGYRGGLGTGCRPARRSRLESLKETARRLAGRRFVHAHVGEEWPPLRAREAGLVARVAAAMEVIEEAAGAQAPPEV